ncbi:MAG: 4a-hydroxytetrahydrobiopterin dehydratase [Pseudomonadota bacterium]
MSDDLAAKACKPYEGGVEPLTRGQAEKLMEALHSNWQLSDDGKTISRRYEFSVYSRTMAFANTVAWIASNEGHHPDMRVSYGACDVSWTTHAIDGLSDNDFICAAKMDRCAATVMVE